MTMIATIAIVAAMAAELDASNMTINKKATTWRWASAESAAMTTIFERSERQRDVKVGRNDREWRRQDKVYANMMTIAATSGKHGRKQTRSLRVSFASTDNAMRVACIVATTTTMAIIATIAIATASEVQEQAPADATDATDVEVATISQTADAAQTAENAADAAMAMTARQMRSKRHDAIASEKETLRDRSDDTFARAMAPPAKRVKTKPHRWQHHAQEAQYKRH